MEKRARWGMSGGWRSGRGGERVSGNGGFGDLEGWLDEDAI